MIVYTPPKAANRIPLIDLDGSFDDSCGRAGESDNGTIVGCVERPIEETHAFDFGGGDYLLDLGGVSAFREVGDALDDGFWVHFELLCIVEIISTSCNRGRAGRWR